MNVLFLTLLSFDSLQEPSIYTDLLREFVKNGHSIYAISPVERHQKQKTHLVEEKNATILRLKIGNTQKTNIIEKGISTVLIEPLFISAIKKYFSNVKFDLVLYSTPPITFCKAIEFVKKRDNAYSYLLLKDIFPQNAVDLGMMTTSGLKSVLYKYFRHKEKRLYAISDRIGCMSPANVKYVLNNNPKVDSEKVEICPNSIEVIDKSVDHETRITIRNKYGIPLDKTVFVYGGNLGKPQGIPFIIDCLKAQHDDRAYFLIVGDGTEYSKLETYMNEFKPSNVKLMKRLPKDDYDSMVAACDVGMIFLDHRFTIPNFPSRLLSYMQAKLPVMACTDSATDLGDIIVKGSFGYSCKSDSINDFLTTISTMLSSNLNDLKTNSWLYLNNYYSVNKAYKTILKGTNYDY